MYTHMCHCITHPTHSVACHVCILRLDISVCLSTCSLQQVHEELATRDTRTETKRMSSTRLMSHTHHTCHTHVTHVIYVTPNRRRGCCQLCQLYRCEWYRTSRVYHTLVRYATHTHIHMIHTHMHMNVWMTWLACHMCHACHTCFTHTLQHEWCKTHTHLTHIHTPNTRVTHDDTYTHHTHEWIQR